MEHNEIYTLAVENGYNEYTNELAKISNQIKAAYGLKLMKNNLRNFVATVNYECFF